MYREVILEKGWLTEEYMEHVMSPEQMTTPGIAGGDLLHK